MHFLWPLERDKRARINLHVLLPILMGFISCFNFHSLSFRSRAFIFHPTSDLDAEIKPMSRSLYLIHGNYKHFGIDVDDKSAMP